MIPRHCCHPSQNRSPVREPGFLDRKPRSREAAPVRGAAAVSCPCKRAAAGLTPTFPCSPAVKNKVKINPSGIHVKNESRTSGVLMGLHNAASSLPSSFLPLLCLPAPPSERRPGGSRKSSSRVSSRQFWEARPRAPRDASGNSRCHSKDGKRARPVSWGSPAAGGKSLESRHGAGKITRGRRA